MSQEKKRDKLYTMDPTEITYDMVGKKLREIVTSRGKKGIDRSEQVEMLEFLAQIAKGPTQKAEVSHASASSILVVMLQLYAMTRLKLHAKTQFHAAACRAVHDEGNSGNILPEQLWM